MKTTDIAFFILATFICIVFGAITLGLLWYFIVFIIELAKNVHWIAIPIGIIALCYCAFSILAAQSK